LRTGYDANYAEVDDVYVMNADGSRKTNLTSKRAGDSSPEWSPDGTRIAFASDRDGDYDIYTMDANGSDVVQVTNLRGDERFPDWQPLTKESRSMTVNPPDTGGPSLLWVASALLFSMSCLLYAMVRPRM
jgi:dipeptidyl aminopeptidase/acylaminoacyl peptidase